MIKKNIAHHISRIQTMEGRGICTDLNFGPNTRIRIIGIYYPASQNPEHTKLTKWITNLIQEANHNNWNIIIMGDFNALSNPSLDRHPKISHKHKSTQPTSELIRNITNFNLIDTYRELNPYQRKFSWQNS